MISPKFFQTFSENISHFNVTSFKLIPNTPFLLDNGILHHFFKNGKKGKIIMIEWKKGGEFMIYVTYYHSPIGWIEINTTAEAVVKVTFLDEQVPETVIKDEHPLLKKTVKQLDEYFKGKRKEFDLPILLKATEFGLNVLKQVNTIPYGTTQSYKEIAKAIGNEKAVRAVGSSNRKNNLLLIVPCHRVIASDHSLSGYAGGIWRKEWLLNNEKDAQ